MARRKQTKAPRRPSGGNGDGFQLTPLGEPNDENPFGEPEAKPKPRRRTSKPKAQEAKPTPNTSPKDHWPAPLHTELECPACGAVVFLDSLPGGGDLWLERQRRIIVFAGPYTDHPYTDPETGEEGVAQLPVQGMTLWEEGTNRLVLGRPATEEERDHFKAHRSLDGVVPWTIGHEGHLARCPRLDRWMSGAAHLRRASLDVTRDGRSYYRLSMPQADAAAREEASP